MVYRIAERGARHRVIGPERSKALPSRERNRCDSERLVIAEHQLMGVGVGVPPVHEALTPISRRQLSLRNGEPLQIERGPEPQPVIQCTGVGHYRGLDDSYL